MTPKTLRGWVGFGRAVLAASFLVTAALLLAADAPATPAEALNQVTLLGIGRTSGNLVMYDFGASELTNVGTVTTGSGQVLTGVDAAAYIPGFQNMFVLWTSPTDGRNKLVYVNVTNASATIMDEDVEGGHFGGAVAVTTGTDTKTHTVFAVQDAKVKPPSAISGLLNINPNNSQQNEFTLTKGTGGNITRDDLAAADNLPGNGTYYEGTATFIHVKPKGNGNQNGLTFDGQTVVLQNSNTYDFSGSMEVRLYNDQVKNGKAMGHWWLQILSGHAYLNDNVQVLFPNRIITVAYNDGAVNEVMRLSRSYRGLATADGVVFYATSGRDLYKIDTAALTETKVGTTGLTTPADGKFVSGYLFWYDIGPRTLGAISPATAGAVSSHVSYGLGDLGAMAFFPVGEYPTASASSYD